MKINIFTLIIVVTMFLSACGNSGNVSLEGTNWELFAIGKHPPIDGSHIKISFEDGQVSGNSGCNSFGGDYKLTGDTIEFGMMMSTMMACADSAMMEQESTFMQLLGDAQRFEVVDGQLKIFWSFSDALIFVPFK